MTITSDYTSACCIVCGKHTREDTPFCVNHLGYTRSVTKVAISFNMWSEVATTREELATALRNAGGAVEVKLTTTTTTRKFL